MKLLVGAVLAGTLLLGWASGVPAADRIAPKPEGVGSPRPRRPTRMDGGPRMRLPNTAHESRPWRIREIAPDFTVQDVWALPVRGGAEDFQTLLELMTSGDPANAESLATRVLWRLRFRLGSWFGWDDAAGELPIPGTNQASLTDRLPDDLRNTAADLQFAHLPFAPLYRTDVEFAAEASNQTVHGVIHLAWDEGRYQGQMAIYVKPRGALGKGYMALIKPFRHWVVYPALMRQIAQAWNTRVSSEGRDRAPPGATSADEALRSESASQSGG